MVAPDVLAELASTIQRWTLGLTREIALSVPLRQGDPLLPTLFSVGGPDGVQVPPPEVFRPAVRAEADAVILIHTHRDDSPASKEDLAVTRRLVAAGAVIGIPLAAHLVVGPEQWVDCLAAAAWPAWSSPTR
jgi:DNA repair protein RadC